MTFSPLFTKKYGDISYYAKGNIWLLIPQLIMGFGGIIIASVFAYILTPEAFGTYKYILSFAALIGIFSLHGIKTALTRAIARSEESVYLPAIRAFALWSIPSSLILLFSSGFYALLGNFTFMWAFGVIALLQPLLHTALLYIPYLHGKKDFKKYALYQSVSSILATLFLLIGILYTSSIVLLIALYYTIHTLTALFFFLKTLPPLSLKEEEEENKTKETLSYAKHLSIMHIWTESIMHADKIIIFHILGAPAVALYTIATIIPMSVKEILKNTGTLLLPKFAMHSTLNETFSTYHKKIPLLFLFLILIYILYIFLSPFFYQIFFPNYQESIFLTQIFALTFLSVPSMFFTQTLLAHKREKSLYIHHGVSAPLNFFTMILGALFYGLIGVIIARIFSLFCSMTLAYILLLYEKNK
jgi:O-antigen/teichoic acid export membrane protein